MQYENTEKNITKFFNELKINYKCDTSIIFLLPPMGCPRCEATINPIIEYLKKINIRYDIILLVVYNNRRAAEKYLNKKAFNFDYKFIIDDSFLEHFYMSVEPLKIPFITKFNNKLGVNIL